MKERLRGLVLLAAGAVFAYWGIYEPLQSADTQTEDVSLYAKGVILCPLAIVSGLVFLILGNRVSGVLGTAQQPKLIGIVFGIVLALIGFGIYFWLKAALRAKGYQI